MSNETNKCWGYNVEVFRNATSSVNILHLKAGKRCSWHRHKTKFNQFHLISGSIILKVGIEFWELLPTKEFTIYSGQWHEFQVWEDSIMVEVMYTINGVQYDPDDIERANVGGDLAF